MKAVWKFPVTPDDCVEIQMPVGAQPLTVQMQGDDDAMLWALCDTEVSVYETRRFRLAGTGHLIQEENLEYINTIQLYGGSLVFHLFEVK